MEHWRYVDIPAESVKIDVNSNKYEACIYGWNKNDKSDREELVQLRCDSEDLRKIEVKIFNYEMLLNDHRILELIDEIQTRFKEEFQGK